MNRLKIKPAAVNVVILAGVALPVLFVLVWLQALVTSGGTPESFRSALTTAGVYYIANFIPVCIGGFAHQLIWLSLPRAWSGFARRLTAFVSTPLIPVAVVVAWGGPIVRLAPIWIPIVMSLALYVVLLRPSEEAQAEVLA